MSASVVDELAAAVGRAVAAVGGDGVPIRLDRPADPEHGDYATAVALQLAKPLRAAPRDIAARIAAALDSDHLASVDVAGPGFLNLRVSAAWYRHAVERILTEGPRYGSGAAATPQRIQVEYVSGNPTGPVTVATARNAAYGDSLARLFAFAGHEVGREYYFNDAGRQIDLFGESLRARARGAEPPADGYLGGYVAEVAAEVGLDPEADAATWARAGTDAMMAHIRATLARFRCSFDSWFLERSLYESGAVQRAMDRVRAGGHVYEQDGATWLRSTALGDDKDRVLVRSDGTYTYVAGDLAYIVDKLERGFDTAMYVLGPDHHGYVGRLKAAAQALGYDPDRIDVQIYQLVRLREGKMSKRAGRIVTLDDLLDAIGVDAARYALVQRGHDQPIDLDIELLTAQNAENPVYYCQYAHARIAAILRKAGGGEARPDEAWTPEPAETQLIKALVEFPGLVAEAAERRGPHRIAGYAQETAKAFHQFYKQCHVIGAEPAVERGRLALCRATAQVMATSLDLVGVEAPESM
ncbi:MAG TPA: arginine--tRNA ligase [Gaiellales bacterium]|jgi:arginyl-tRNA synthetase